MRSDFRSITSCEAECFGVARAAESELSFRAFIRAKSSREGLDARWLPDGKKTVVRHLSTGRHRAVAPPAW